jgi:hypothetical protein
MFGSSGSYRRQGSARSRQQYRRRDSVPRESLNHFWKSRLVHVAQGHKDLAFRFITLCHHLLYFPEM